jgi:hypothetical protein
LPGVSTFTSPTAKANGADLVVSGGALTLSGIGPIGFPSLETLIQNGNLNLTLSTDQIDEVGGKAELGFPITSVCLLSQLVPMAKLMTH